MIFTTYEITNKINYKYYIGVHKTNNIDDNYLGSGSMLKKAKKKYGKYNFSKLITGVWRSEEIMFLMEEWLVTKAQVKDTNCYNLRKGGDSSPNWCVGKTNKGIKLTEEHKLKISPLGRIVSNKTKEKISKNSKLSRYSKNNGLYHLNGNRTAKNVLYIDPYGERFIVFNRSKQFCKEKNISYTLLLKNENKVIFPNNFWRKNPSKVSLNTIGWRRKTL